MLSLFQHTQCLCMKLSKVRNKKGLGEISPSLFVNKCVENQSPCSCLQGLRLCKRGILPEFLLYSSPTLVGTILVYTNETSLSTKIFIKETANNGKKNLLLLYFAYICRYMRPYNLTLGKGLFIQDFLWNWKTGIGNLGC